MWGPGFDPHIPARGYLSALSECLTAGHERRGRRKSWHGMLSSLWVDAIQRIAISLELCLDTAAFLLLPILVLAPHGIAPLATIAGGVALGLVLRNGKAEFRPLQLPAALLGPLLVWGTVSAGWSVDPAHSLLIAARLGGLFAAGLVLTAAAGALVCPRRLLLCFYIGLVLALVLVSIQFATNGLLTHPFVARVRCSAAESGQRYTGVSCAAGECLSHPPRTDMALVNAGDGYVDGHLRPRRDGSEARPRCRNRARRAPLCRASPYRPIGCDPLRPDHHYGAIDLCTAGTTARRDRDGRDGQVFRLAPADDLVFRGGPDRRATARRLGLDAARAIPEADEPIAEGRVWLPLHPHNAAIQVWLELGVPGAVLFALIIAWLWLTLGADPWPRLFTAATGASLISAFVAAIGAYGIWQEGWSGTLWFSLFLISVMSRCIRGRETRSYRE